MELVELLRRNRHFARLPAPDLAALAGAFTLANHLAGEILFSEGDRGESVFLVVEGEVEITHRERKREHSIARLRPGELFGLRAAIGEHRRSATCTVAAPSRLASLSGQGVKLLFNQSAPICYAFQKALAAQLARDLRAADQRLRGMLTDTGR
jgi:CRP/FNR family transcriptional regulator, cyclic AMP receptor protein